MKILRTIELGFTIVAILASYFFLVKYFIQDDFIKATFWGVLILVLRPTLHKED
jgi:hypothetical protein